ncbi:MAG: hypothetical protein KF830_02435 [Planctomycetes bacterium]|nr:hypothetical protein [Planctomycetota bacterium]
MPSAPLSRRAPHRSAADHGVGHLVGIVAATGLLTIAISEHWFPWWPLQLFLREWVLHWSAVVAVTLTVALVLGIASDPGGRRRRTALAVVVPFTLLALHELGQWLYPVGERDDFDSVRDVALNLLGTLCSWWVLRHLPRGSGTARAAPPSG